jgi:Flp pilus assembly protein TadG
MLKTINRFLKDTSGNYATLTAFLLAPLMMGVSLAVDYSELTRQRSILFNAADAAGMAMAREYEKGASEADASVYGEQFFNQNLSSLDVGKVTFTPVFPTAAEKTADPDRGDVEVIARLRFDPYFYGPALRLMGVSNNGSVDIKASASVRIRLRSAAEIALVLDNSGSMDYLGSGSSTKRIDLLKTAAKQLVRDLSINARNVVNVSNPLQFSIVPFAASVNVGAGNAGTAWMDTTGISPVHHENFDWSTMPAGYQVTKVGSVYRKTGLSWPVAERNQVVSRFTLFNSMKRRRYNNNPNVNNNTKCEWSSGSPYDCNYKAPVQYTTPRNGTSPYNYASWGGCVEMRPWPYMVNDSAPKTADPASMYVPMFAPDEPGDYSATSTRDMYNYDSFNSYLNDVAAVTTDPLYRQSYMWKYFAVQPALDNSTTAGRGDGPNESCTTAAITPLKETVTTAGETQIRNAIDTMQPNGYTNVTQGIVWGWATLSSHAPFSEGRPEKERGNEKIMIVLTDGMNTYRVPSSKDAAENDSVYAAYGYTGRNMPGTNSPRIFQGTSVTGAKYSEAMIEHMAAACNNAKLADITIFTVALDLKYNATSGTGTDKKMGDALKECASRSKKDKDKRLFWNTTGGDIDETFRAIADELSNLRFVG